MSRSDPTVLTRSRRRGVLLFESLIAVALLTSVVVGGLVSAFYSARTEAGRRAELWLSEFARSKAEEYIVTYPALPASGTDDSRWSWQIDEVRMWPDGIHDFDQLIALYQLTVTVRDASRPDVSYRDTTIMARRP